MKKIDSYVASTFNYKYKIRQIYFIYDQ